MATSKLIAKTKEDNQIATGIVQRVRGNSVCVEISGSISMPSAAQTTIGTITKHIPSNHVYAVASVGGSSNKFVLITVQTSGAIVVYNYTGSAQSYLFGSISYLI